MVPLTFGVQILLNFPHFYLKFLVPSIQFLAFPLRLGLFEVEFDVFQVHFVELHRELLQLLSQLPDFVFRFQVQIVKVEQTLLNQQRVGRWVDIG